MRRGVMALAFAGISAGALGQGVTLHFTADRTTSMPGDTVHWVVSASFTGYGSTAYFGGFVGDFPASDPALGEALNLMPLMAGVYGAHVADGASIENVHIFNSALLGTNDPANPIDIFEFDVLVSAIVGELSYGADGIASMFENEGIFTLPDEYTAFEVITDRVSINPPCGIADLSAPFGLLDLSDVNAFAGAFMAGCPSLGDSLVLIEAHRSWSYNNCLPFPPYDCTTWWDEYEGYGGWRLSAISESGAWGNFVVEADEPDDFGWESLSLTFEVTKTTLIDAHAYGPGSYQYVNRLERFTPDIETIFDGLWTDQDGATVTIEPGTYLLTIRIGDFMSTFLDFTFRVSTQPPPCGSADLVEPHYLLDLADIVAFMEAFVAGCP